MQFMLDTYATKRYTLEESWQLNVEHDALRALHAEQLRKTGVDAILCPVAPSVAARHGEARYWGYSAVWNALDLPAVVMPVGVVSEGDTWESVGVEAVRSSIDGEDVKDDPVGRMDEQYRSMFDEGPAKYKDAPTAVQLVGERLQEERLMAIAEVLDGLLRGDTELVEGSGASQSKKVNGHQNGNGDGLGVHGNGNGHGNHA